MNPDETQRETTQMPPQCEAAPGKSDPGKPGGNSYLYAWEGIACMMVVLIHCRLPGRTGDLAAAYARFAVPFFFAVAGWFFFAGQPEKGAGTDHRAIRKKALARLRRTACRTAWIWLVYTSYSLFRHLLAGESAISWMQAKFSSGERRIFWLFNSGKVIYDWTYVYDHLWFLFALIYVYVLIFIFAPVLRQWMKPLCVLLLALLFFGELLRIYYPVRPFDISIRTWYVLRNWLLEGMPFVLLGMWLRAHRCERGWILILTGLVSTTAEFWLFGEAEVYAGSVMTTAGILLQAGAVPRRMPRVLSRIGEYCAGSVYYWHVLVWALINFAWPENHLHPWFVWVKPAIVFVLAMAPAALKHIRRHDHEMRE